MDVFSRFSSRIFNQAGRVATNLAGGLDLAVHAADVAARQDAETIMAASMAASTRESPSLPVFIAAIATTRHIRM